MKAPLRTSLRTFGYLCPRKNVVALADKREIPIKDENIGSELESLDVRNARMSSPGRGVKNASRYPALADGGECFGQRARSYCE